MRRERLDLGADQLQVLGRERVGERDRLARASATSTSANAASPTVGRSTTSASSAAAERARTTVRGRRDRGDEAALAVLGLGEHVERGQRSSRSPTSGAEHDQQVARAGEAVDADERRELVLGLLHVQVARARRSRRRARPSRCRRRARRSPARRPCGTRARPRTAGTCRGSPGRSAPSGPGGAHTATSSTPAARAVTTPITTVLGIGGAPAGHVHGGGADRHLAQDDALPLRQLDRDVLARRPRRRRCATLAIATCRPATSSSGSCLIASSSSSALDAAAAAARRRPVSKPARVVEHRRVAAGADRGDDLAHVAPRRTRRRRRSAA